MIVNKLCKKCGATFIADPWIDDLEHCKSCLGIASASGDTLDSHAEEDAEVVEVVAVAESYRAQTPVPDSCLRSGADIPPEHFPPPEPDTECQVQRGNIISPQIIMSRRKSALSQLFLSATKILLGFMSIIIGGILLDTVNGGYVTQTRSIVYFFVTAMFFFCVALFCFGTNAFIADKILKPLYRRFAPTLASYVAALQARSDIGRLPLRKWLAYAEKGVRAVLCSPEFALFGLIMIYTPLMLLVIDASDPEFEIKILIFFGFVAIYTPLILMTPPIPSPWAEKLQAITFAVSRIGAYLLVATFVQHVGQEMLNRIVPRAEPFPFQYKWKFFAMVPLSMWFFLELVVNAVALVNDYGALMRMRIGSLTLPEKWHDRVLACRRLMRVVGTIRRGITIAWLGIGQICATISTNRFLLVGKVILNFCVVYVYTKNFIVFAKRLIISTESLSVRLRPLDNWQYSLFTLPNARTAMVLLPVALWLAVDAYCTIRRLLSKPHKKPVRSNRMTRRQSAIFTGIVVLFLWLGLKEMHSHDRDYYPPARVLGDSELAQEMLAACKLGKNATYRDVIAHIQSVLVVRETPEFCYFFGKCLEVGGYGLTGGEPAAEEWYWKAAKSYHTEATYELAWRAHQDGDNEFGLGLLLKAAKRLLPDPKVQYLLAISYDDWADRPDLGISWLLAAAEENYPRAQGELASWLLDGRGVRQNQKEGLRWLQIAAKNGDPFAMASIRYANAQVERHRARRK